MLCKCLRQPYLVLAAAVADRGMPALRCRCYRWCCSCGGLVTKAGTVPYAQALAACRKAVRGAARQLVLALPGLLVC